MKLKRKIIGLLLTVSLVAGLMPTMAFAAESATDTGTDADADKAIQLVKGGTAANISGGQTGRIFFGTYQQSRDGNSGYNRDPIMWRVLSNADGKLFLLSDKNLDVVQYHKEYKVVTWETSTLRSWLNGLGGEDDSFLNTAFSEEEQDAVAMTGVINADNEVTDGDKVYQTDGGNNTVDKIFLLSITEAKNKNYFANDGNRIAVNTAYVADGGKTESGDMSQEAVADYWWLRSPGITEENAVLVREDGSVDPKGTNADRIDNAVRPAFNLDLSSVLLISAPVGGKSPDTESSNQASQTVGSIFETKPYSGGIEWKLTLKDDSRRSFSVLTTEVADADKKLTLAYTGAAVGSNEYVSALITDANGTVTHYGRLKNVSDETMKSGTVEVTLPEGFNFATEQLYVFSEQYNGDKMTDYASELKRVSFTKNAYQVINNLMNMSSDKGVECLAEIGHDYTDTFRTTGVYRVPEEITVKVGGTELAAGTDYEYSPSADKMSAALKILSEKVTGNIEVAATAAEAPIEPPIVVTYYDITAEQTEHGKIELSADRIYRYGDVDVMLTADEGYEVKNLLINGKSVGAVSNYTIKDVTEDIRVTAVFAETDAAKNDRIAKGVQNTTIRMYYKKDEIGKGWIKLHYKKSFGFKVDNYEIFRSTKKKTAFGEKPFFVTKKNKVSGFYKNTKNVKKGIRYYYKMRGVREIDGKSYYTGWSNIVMRTGR